MTQEKIELRIFKLYPYLPLISFSRDRGRFAENWLEWASYIRRSSLLSNFSGGIGDQQLDQAIQGWLCGQTYGGSAAWQ
jgi:hypothetical protein